MSINISPRFKKIGIIKKTPMPIRPSRPESAGNRIEPMSAREKALAESLKRDNSSLTKTVETRVVAKRRMITGVSRPSFRD